VFNNDLADGSFGVTSPIYLYLLKHSGAVADRFEVPTNQMVTSFSSKSELAINPSVSGRALSFMGYVAAPGALDVSNSNTPGAIDPTNPVSSAYYRAVGVINDNGRLNVTETNAYSGNNGRAAILNDTRFQPLIYTAGNAGNGANPQPAGVVSGAGAQIMNEQFAPEADQSPGTPTPVGSFSITQLGYKPDKVGKDDNFRGLTQYDGVLYFTKGSGSNGVNTVYFLDTSGQACPNGSGVPAPGASLPTAPLSGFNPATGLPTNMCILRGFPTGLAKTDTNAFPFGLWFANPHTLYVADEGNGTNTYDPNAGTYTAAADQTQAGLQKWVYDPSAGAWEHVDTLSAGLNLGQPYTVPGYPGGTNSATGLPWAPATDGLRNLTGRVNRDGSVTVYAVTSTVSGSGDQGADPNKVVKITDDPAATTAGSESFTTVRSAASGQVLRGVAVIPGSREHR